MGLKIGTPIFQVPEAIRRQVQVRSANFALYGDMSDRMMSLAAGLGHRQEVYCIELIPKTAIDASTASILPVGKSLTSTM